MTLSSTATTAATSRIVTFLSSTKITSKTNSLSRMYKKDLFRLVFFKIKISFDIQPSLLNEDYSRTSFLSHMNNVQVIFL